MKKKKLKHLEEYPSDSLETKLDEVFNSSAKIRWEKLDNSLEGFFESNDNSYKVEIENFNDALGIPNPPSIFGLKFYVLDEDGKWSTSLLNNSRNPLSVFGTLRVGVLDFMDKFQPDIIFYIASDSKRKSLYSNLTHMLILERDRYSRREIKSGTTTIFTVSRSEMNTNDLCDEIVKRPGFENWINPEK